MLVDGYRKLALMCSQARKPQVNKKKDVVPAGQRNRSSKRRQCQWRVNINAAPLNSDIPFFTLVRLQHNHKSWDRDELRRSTLDRFTSEQQTDVHEFADLGRSKIADHLKRKYGGNDFDNKSQLKRISNLKAQMQQQEKQAVDAEGGQMAFLVRRLRDLKAADDNWIYHIEHDQNNRLSRLFWQTPGQVAVFRLYGRILEMDVAMDRNAYRMPLTTFIVVDGDFRSRNVAHCLHDKQDTDAFAWMLGCLKTTLVPGTHILSAGIETIISDGDEAMASAIAAVLPDAFYMRCLYHILLNLKKNLGKLLHPNYQRFSSEFFWVYLRPSKRHGQQCWNTGQKREVIYPKIYIPTEPNGRLPGLEHASLPVNARQDELSLSIKTRSSLA